MTDVMDRYRLMDTAKRLLGDDVQHPEGCRPSLELVELDLPRIP